MILVDSSVWIDFFAGKKSIHTDILFNSIEQSDDICICGLILAEVLQGVKSDKEFERVKGILLPLIYLPITKAMFVKSASIYRIIRKHGKTIRSPIDCMIASICIEHEVRLLHNDNDYDIIAHYSYLQIANTAR